MQVSVCEDTHTRKMKKAMIQRVTLLPFLHSSLFAAREQSMQISMAGCRFV